MIFLIILSLFNTLGLYYIVHEMNIIRNKMEGEEKMKWYFALETPPPTGVDILVEFDGCKLGDHVITKIRMGEGLGHIKRWRHLTEDE